jgi:hypothetical protein
MSLCILLSACGSLEKQAILIKPGDTREQVQAGMGVPGDRQFQGDWEAWQYCQTGAGFGYHDYRIVWFRQGQVTGLTSYKSTKAGTLCESDFRQIRWEDAPDYSIEVRQR